MKSPVRFMARGLAEEVGDENPRHCGADDRIREAIQKRGGLDCFVACAPRSDGSTVMTTTAVVNVTAAGAVPAAAEAARAMRRACGRGSTHRQGRARIH